MARIGYESGGIRTPGYVLSEMRTVDTFIRALTQDAAREADHLPQPFKNGFVPFVQEWREFYSEYSEGAVAWGARGTTPVYNKVLEYRRLAQKWRDRFVKLGGESSNPELPEPKPFSPWPYIVGGGIVAAGLYFIFGGNRGDE